MEYSIPLTGILALIAFAVAVFVLFKVFKFLAKALMVAGISFAFPWFVKFLGFPVSFEPSFSVSLHFLIVGMGFFVLHELWGVISRVFSVFRKR